MSGQIVAVISKRGTLEDLSEVPLCSSMHEEGNSHPASGLLVPPLGF